MINGYKINYFKSKDDFLTQICNKKIILIAMNAEKIMKKNEKLKDIINNNIGYPDGIGAVWALKQKGFKNSIRIPGCEFWLDIIENSYRNKKIYLLGSTNKVVENIVKKLKLEFKNINIVGYRDGFLKDGDKEKLKNDLKILQPDIVFVAQGSPKQEFLMDELIKECPALYVGLGGSFDIYAGLKQRAPKFFLYNNIEWLYRLLKEPTRIQRDIILIKFLFLLFFKKI